MKSKNKPTGIAHLFPSWDTSITPPIFVTKAKIIINTTADIKMVGSGVV
jgi:hypothetical protein